MSTLLNKQVTKTTLGVLSKGWYKNGDSTVLVKGNSLDLYSKGVGYEPYSEVLASKLAHLLGLDCVDYELCPASMFPEITTYDCDYVSVCKRIPLHAGQQLVHFAEFVELVKGVRVSDYFNVYFRLGLPAEFLVQLLVLDAVTGNSDRHLNNFDVIVCGSEVVMAPIMDNGAGLLGTITDAKLKPFKGKGPDKAKPFKGTHERQIHLLQRRFPRLKCFCCDKEEVYNRWLVECKDIFNKLPPLRAELIKVYVERRLDFIDAFNSKEVDFNEINAF